ncbi:MAG: type II toxin-antitoxin system RelE family toxin [Thermodesulfobacteriota bacterium]
MTRLIVPRDIHDLIRKMHPDLKKKIRASLEMTIADPNSGKALIGELSGLRSMRVSSSRIIYRIRSPKEIELVAIGPRDRIYEETFHLIQKLRGDK